MKLIWQIELEDIERVKAFLAANESSPFVRQRINRNLVSNKPAVQKYEFWRQLVACLLTTQQRSGPNSAVSRFICTKPFPLEYARCVCEPGMASWALGVLTDFGGLRRTNTIAKQIDTNLSGLENGLWQQTMEVLDGLQESDSSAAERDAAHFVDDHFVGFGPKQSRNLLQSLGLTKYEIPIDSRITKWLNDYGFPVTLSAAALADRNYYAFVSAGFQQLCAAAEIKPCVMDAAIFASFDDGAWTETNVVW